MALFMILHGCNSIPFIEQIRLRLSEPLPGRDAQLRMAFARRAEELRLNPATPEGARVACVTLMLWQKNNDWHTVLIERTKNPLDRHSGQISFPGGKHDSSDGSWILGDRFRDGTRRCWA